MVGLIQKIKAGRRIPQEVYQLLDSINSRYSQIDFNSRNFVRLNEEGKLSKLIGLIKRDPELSRLVSLSGGADAIYKSLNEEDSPIGWGTTLCIGKKGLFIFHLDTLQNKRDIISATSKSLKKELDFGVGEISEVEMLRGCIVNYTKRENYIERVADFRKYIN